MALMLYRVDVTGTRPSVSPLQNVPCHAWFSISAS